MIGWKKKPECHRSKIGFHFSLAGLLPEPESSRRFTIALSIPRRANHGGFRLDVHEVPCHQYSRI